MDLELVLRAIEECVFLVDRRAIRRLYTPEGKRILSPDQIKNNLVIIVAGRELFHCTAYGSSLPRITVSQPRKITNCQRNQEMSVMEGASQGENHFTPDPNLAATLIQAQYRGYRTRKSLAAMQHHELAELHQHAIQQRHPQQPTATAVKVSETEASHGHHFTGDPDSAATLIQASYRGYRTRKSLGSRLSHASEENQSAGGGPQKMSPTTAAATELQTTRSPLRTLGLKDISNNQSESSEEVLNRAATIIQASYRGYHVRHELHKHDNAEYHVHQKDAVVSPEPDEAAKKIQAAFRGYRVRKQYRSQTTPISPVSFGPEDAKYVAAATKIQASYRGYRTRKTSNFRRSSATSKK